jgi:hypothetical protein
MGYTHYWYRLDGSNDREAFRQLGTDAKRIIAQAERNGIRLANWDGTGEPEFTELSFALNGVGEEAHESFRWKVNAERHEMDTDEWLFDFTKTAYKPYDAVVTAILIRAKVLYGDAVRVESDGSWDDWAEGRALYEQVFGIDAPSPFRREEVGA